MNSHRRRNRYSQGRRWLSSAPSARWLRLQRRLRRLWSPPNSPPTTDSFHPPPNTMHPNPHPSNAYTLHSNNHIPTPCPNNKPPQPHHPISPSAPSTPAPQSPASNANPSYPKRISCSHTNHSPTNHPPLASNIVAISTWHSSSFA